MRLFSSLFRRRPQTAIPTAGQTAEAVPLAVSPYYEVWGGMESVNTALWVALWFAILVVILCLLLLRSAALKPPIVIRVTDAGEAQVVPNPGRQPPVSAAELKNFLSLFERFFTGLNAYTYDADLRLAFSMMSPAFQSKAGDLLKKEGTIETVKANQERITLTLTDFKVIRDTPDILECRILGSRQIGTYKQDGVPGEVVFEDDVILRKLPRSEKAPYGILVEDYHESIFKK